MSTLDDLVESQGVDLRVSLNLFSAMTSRASREKGFHQSLEDADWLESMATRMRSHEDFSADEMDTFGDRLDEIAKRMRLLEVGTKLMLIVSELSEGFESLRNTGFDGHIDGEGNLGEELADAAIRLGDLAGMVETQLGNDITDKMTVNKNRPYRHGRHA